MSRGQLSKLADDFVYNASWLYKANNLYYVSYLFPSLGVVDFLTSHLKANFTKTAEDKKLLAQVSSYLQEYVIKCWEACGIECEVGAEEAESLIIIKGLNVKPINLQNILTSLFLNVPKDLFIDRRTSVPLSAQSDYVSLFIQGFLRGAYFEPSAEVDEVFGSEYNGQLDKVIAKQIAEWHEVVYPEVKIAHLPELYLTVLNNRHFLASEEAPMLREVRSFVAYFKSLGVDVGMAGRKLSRVFIASPYEYLSILGAVLVGAETKIENISPQVLANFKVRNYAIPLVRKALYVYKELLGLKLDWIDDKENSESLDGKLLEYERALSFMPWLKLTPKFICSEYSKNPELQKYIMFLREGDFFGSQALLDSLLEQEPANLELRIQRAYYYFVVGDLERGHEYCKQLMSESKIENYFEFFAIWGDILLHMNQLDVALRYFKLAFNYGDLPKYRKSEIGNSLAWCYILLGMKDEARTVLMEIEGLPSLECASVLLNRMFISEEKGPLPEDLVKAIDLAPMDRRVFNNLILLGRVRVEKGELNL